MNPQPPPCHRVHVFLDRGRELGFLELANAGGPGGSVEVRVHAQPSYNLVRARMIERASFKGLVNACALMGMIAAAEYGTRLC